MKVTITQKTDEPLLSRTSVAGDMVFEGPTPSKAQAAEVLGKQLSHDPKLVVIGQLLTQFGKTSGTVSARMYKDQESLSKIEGITIKEEKKEAEGEAKADAPKEEAKAEEKPADDAKEAPKEEAKVEEKPAEEAKPEAKEEPKAEEKPKEEGKPEAKEEKAEEKKE